MDDPSFQMKNIFVPIVQHPCTGLFTTNASCAIHNDISVFFRFEHICRHGQLFPECITWYFNGVSKPSHLVFIMIPHIYDHGIGIFNHFIERYRCNVFSFVLHREQRIFNPISHYFIPDFDIQYIEGIAMLINSFI